MTVYIIWPKTIDSEFRTDYESVVGESVQENPFETSDTLHWCVGSSRVTEEHINQLTGLYPNVLFSQTAPENYDA